MTAVEVLPTTAEEWQAIAHRSEAVVEQAADDPGALVPLMHECHVLLLDIARLLARLNDERYTAEREFVRVRSVTMGRFIEQGATFARAAADVAALDARAAADEVKVLFHHAEDTQKALQAKHYALMNVNRGIQSAMFEGGRRG